MLINWMYGKPRDDHKERLLSALGLEHDFGRPAWPLPNLKPSDEREFWGYRASRSFKAEVWVDSVPIAYQNPRLIIFWDDSGYNLRGGFAVAIFYRHTCAHHPVYYRWTACDHDFNVSDSRMCWREYTCSKCGDKFDVDSS